MKEFIINANGGYSSMGRILCSCVPDVRTLICAECGTAAAVEQPERHALSFHSNLLM